MFFIHFVHFSLFQLHFHHLLLFQHGQLLVLVAVTKWSVSFSWCWELERVFLTRSVTEFITILSPDLWFHSFISIQIQMFLLRVCLWRQSVNSHTPNLTFKGKWIWYGNNFLLDSSFIKHIYIFKWLHQWVFNVKHLIFWSKLLFASEKFGNIFLLFLYHFTSFLQLLFLSNFIVAHFRHIWWLFVRDHIKINLLSFFIKNADLRLNFLYTWFFWNNLRF